MAEQRELVLGKAEPTVTDHPVPDTHIQIRLALPHFDGLQAWDAYTDREAYVLEEALSEALPGGTYDRLLGRMMTRLATHFRVSHTS